MAYERASLASYDLQKSQPLNGIASPREPRRHPLLPIIHRPTHPVQTLKVGSSAANDIILRHTSVPPHHLEISLTFPVTGRPHRVLSVCDLPEAESSFPATTLNGVPVVAPVPLKHGDRIAVPLGPDRAKEFVFRAAKLPPTRPPTPGSPHTRSRTTPLTPTLPTRSPTARTPSPLPASPLPATPLPATPLPASLPPPRTPLLAPRSPWDPIAKLRSILKCRKDQGRTGPANGPSPKRAKVVAKTENRATNQATTDTDVHRPSPHRRGIRAALAKTTVSTNTTISSRTTLAITPSRRIRFHPRTYVHHIPRNTPKNRKASRWVLTLDPDVVGTTTLIDHTATAIGTGSVDKVGEGDGIELDFALPGGVESPPTPVLTGRRGSRSPPGAGRPRDRE